MSNTTESSTWKDAFKSRDDLVQYGDNALGLFALELRFGIDDIHSVASESITDGSDDKKCDLIFIDRDEGVAVVAQCYNSSKEKPSAPANKASDLNTAVGWLLQQPVESLPERIKSPAIELRSAIIEGKIARVEAWYVHNLPESKSVTRELNVVESTMKAALLATYSQAKVEVAGREVGDEAFEEMYKETLSPILVGEDFKIEVESGFLIKSNNWKSYVTAVPARFLHRIYKQHKTRLFSANVRDYLGSRSSDNNINNGIKITAEQYPQDFWVFNNGITILTHSFKEIEDRGEKYLSVRGISIVNGAQTTGAIGSLKKAPSDKAKVPARFVQTLNTNLVYDIIQYNNSQNKVTASDFRSTDRIQKRLRLEVEAIPNAKYEGGRRGGHRDAIERNKNLLPSYTVGQAIAAFHLEPIAAYNQKSEIWVSDRLYSRFFNEDITGTHLVFCYSLFRAVEEAKKTLVLKSKQNQSALTSQETDLLAYFRLRGSVCLLSSAVASCMETLAGRKIANMFRISFISSTSPKQAVTYWTEIVNLLSPFSNQLNDALSDGLKNNERVQKAISTFRSLVQATSNANIGVYKRFGSNITLNK